MGDGTRVKFWEDVWCGDFTLRRYSQNFIVLVEQGSLPLWRLCISMMEGSIGMFSSVIQCMIEN